MVSGALAAAGVLDALGDLEAEPDAHEVVVPARLRHGVALAEAGADGGLRVRGRDGGDGDGQEEGGDEQGTHGDRAGIGAGR